VIPREEWFSRTERKPCGESDSADTHTDREARPTNKRDQRGRIYGRNNVWPWEPAPSDADVNPPSIVKLAESPRFILYPR
jgi:hypothetical protein